MIFKFFISRQRNALRTVLQTLIVIQCSVAIASAQAPLDVLFIGNSLTYYNELPKVFEELVLGANKKVSTDFNAPGGRSIFEHAHDSITLAKIHARKWDFIVLQGSGPRIAYPETFHTKPYAEGLNILKPIIKANSPSTRIILFMPWAYEDGMTWYEGWRQDFTTMQRDIYHTMLELANTYDLSISPIGWTWYQYLKLKSFPEHYLHLSDWVHPTEKGTYLSACVLYASIFLEESFGNSYLASLNITEAREFQTLADDIVITDSTKWKLSKYIDSTPFTPTNTRYIRNNANSDLILYQNYPNPFESTSQIKFELKRSMPVHIQVFDIKGKSCGVVLNESLEQGIHFHPINGSDLSNGLYFYKVTAGNQIQTQKFQIQKSHSR